MADLPFEKRNGILIFREFEKNYMEADFKKRVQALLSGELKDNRHSILFNLETVKLVNSHGITALMEIIQHQKKHQGVAAICCINDSFIEATFRDTGIYWAYNGHIYDSEDAAIAALEKLS